MDQIAAVAVRHFKVPIAVVTMLGGNRTFFAGSVGLPPDHTPRDYSLSLMAMRSDEPLIVEDVTADPKTRASAPVVSGKVIRFFAGAPLVSGSDSRLGTVCILDFAPRELNFGQKLVLKHLARVAAEELTATERCLGSTW